MRSVKPHIATGKIDKLILSLSLSLFLRRNKFAREIMVILCPVFFVLLPFSMSASESARETAAFKSAVALFNDGFYEQADNAFKQYIAEHPNSSHIPEVVLLQGQAKYKLKNFANAIQTLQDNFQKARNLADEYLFWIAESYYALSNYTAAVENYNKIITEYPKSKRLMDAAYKLALSYFHLNQFQRVIEILGNTNSVFHTAPKAQTNIEQIARANLLLAETRIKLGDYALAESTLKSITTAPLNDELQWRWHYLMCRALFDSGKIPEALSISTNLISIAQKINKQQIISQSALIVSSIYEKLNRKKDVIDILDKFINSFEDEQRRFALLKIVELSAELGNLNEAASRLENYSTTFTNETSIMDVILLTAGEYRLKEYWLSIQKRRTNDTIAATPAESNLLKQAYAHFNRIIADFPKSPLLPKAQLQRGWCLWLSGDIQASRDAFQTAADKLPRSEDQAIALFKLGDAELFLNNNSNAIRNYKLLISNYINEPKIKETILDQALYQLLRAATGIGDLPSAEDAIAKLLSLFPDSDFSKKSILLMGQAYNRIDNPQKARELLEAFIKKFPTSPLVPEVILAISKSYIQERNFTAAVKSYDEWYAKYSTNMFKPQAEFDRAFAHYQAGNETNALLIFSKFIEKYPTDELSALARFWIGHFYFRHRDYTNAETQFQLIYQNTNFQKSIVAYEARMMAGKSAYARQGFKNAADYFRSLINDENCPQRLLIEAWFALGDTLIEEGSADPARKTQQFNEAIVAFNKIPQIAPTNSLVPAAYGRIGDCYLQLAAENPENFQRAREFYQKVISSNADISIRSQAEVGLGIIDEKLAALKLPQEKEPLLKQALEHYLNVIYGRNIKPELDERPDPFWVKKASLSAINILETTQQWEQLLNLCSRLQSILPSLSDTFAKKITLAQEKLGLTNIKK